MTIYTHAPAARLYQHDKPTLLVSWWCTCFAAVIILIRVLGRFVRSERLFREDLIALLCLVPLFTRMGLVHAVLLYGTNNVDGGSADVVGHLDIHRRILGSKIVLGSRIFYAATLWMLKLTISEFFKRLTIQIWRQSYERTLQGIRWFLLISFVAIVIVDLTECQPLSHAWQVVPDPGGSCRQGYAQLITMGTANVVTDLLLVLFPVPIILRSQMRKKRKAQLVLLFAGSLLPAATTLFRVPRVIQKDGSQQYRSLLASVEILFATAVANGLILGSFARDRGVKKQRWKLGSLSDNMTMVSDRRGPLTRQWGSDEDLVRDLGLGVDPKLRGEKPPPRAAPMALPGVPSAAAATMPAWQFSGVLEGKGKKSILPGTDGTSPDDMSIAPITPTRRVSFFDAVGLPGSTLPAGEQSSSSAVSTGDVGQDGADSPASTRPQPPLPTCAPVSNGSAPLSPAPPGRSSNLLLQDIGGLLGPPTRVPRTGALERDYELQHALRDQHEQRQWERERDRVRSGGDGDDGVGGAEGGGQVRTGGAGAVRSSAVEPTLAPTARGLAPPKLTHQMSLQDVGGLLK